MGRVPYMSGGSENLVGLEARFELGGMEAAVDRYNDFVRKANELSEQAGRALSGIGDSASQGMSKTDATMSVGITSLSAKAGILGGIYGQVGFAIADAFDNATLAIKRGIDSFIRDLERGVAMAAKTQADMTMIALKLQNLEAAQAAAEANRGNLLKPTRAGGDAADNSDRQRAELIADLDRQEQDRLLAAARRDDDYLRGRAESQAQRQSEITDAERAHQQRMQEIADRASAAIIQRDEAVTESAISAAQRIYEARLVAQERLLEMEEQYRARVMYLLQQLEAVRRTLDAQRMERESRSRERMANVEATAAANRARLAARAEAANVPETERERLRGAVRAADARAMAVAERERARQAAETAEIRRRQEAALAEIRNQVNAETAIYEKARAKLILGLMDQEEKEKAAHAARVERADRAAEKTIATLVEQERRESESYERTTAKIEAAYIKREAAAQLTYARQIEDAERAYEKERIAAERAFAAIERARAQAMAAAGEEPSLVGRGVPSIEDVIEMVEELSDTTAFTEDQIRSAIDTLTNFRSIGADVFKPTVRLVADLAQKMGGGPGSLTSAAYQLGRALENPTTGMRYLKLQGIGLSDAEEDHIKALMQQGKQYEAQAFLLENFQTRLNDLADVFANTIPGKMIRANAAISEAWESLGTAFLPVEGTLADVRLKIAEIVSSIVDKLATPEVQNAIKTFADFMAEEFKKFTDWLMSPEGQAALNSFIKSVTDFLVHAVPAGVAALKELLRLLFGTQITATYEPPAAAPSPWGQTPGMVPEFFKQKAIGPQRPPAQMPRTGGALQDVERLVQEKQRIDESTGVTLDLAQILRHPGGPLMGIGDYIANVLTVAVWRELWNTSKGIVTWSERNKTVVDNFAKDSSGIVTTFYGDATGKVDQFGAAGAKTVKTVAQVGSQTVDKFAKDAGQVVKDWGTAADMDIASWYTGVNEDAQAWPADFSELGGAAVRGFSSSLSAPENVNAVRAATASVYTSGIQTEAGTWQGKFTTLAGDTVKGFIAGLTDPLNVQKVLEAFIGLIVNPIDTIKKLFDMHSPSRVMMRMGQDVAMGMALGLDAGRGDVLEAARRMADGAMSEFEAMGTPQMRAGLGFDGASYRPFAQPAPAAAAAAAAANQTTMNLTIHTAAPVESVANDFALMRALIGVS